MIRRGRAHGACETISRREEAAMPVPINIVWEYNPVCDRPWAQGSCRRQAKLT